MSWQWISCFPHGLWTHEAWSQCYGKKHVELCRRDWEWQGPSVHIINPCHQSIAHELVSSSWQLRKQGYGIVLFPLSSLHDRWRYPESSQSSWTSRLCPIRCGDHALPRPFRSLHMTTHSRASMKKINCHAHELYLSRSLTFLSCLGVRSPSAAADLQGWWTLINRMSQIHPCC